MKEEGLKNHKFKILVALNNYLSPKMRG